MRPIVMCRNPISTHTPLRGVTDCCFSRKLYNYISTHTPLRGVTTFDPNNPIIRGISTHTPLRGVTEILIGCFGLKFNFNSHASARRDYIAVPRLGAFQDFNSHASARRDNICK